MEFNPHYILLYDIPRMTETKARHLLKKFKSVEEIFKASKEELLTVEGISEELVEYLKNPKTKESLDKIKVAESLKVKTVSFLDKEYPKALLNFDDSPPVLFIRGEIKEEDELAISIIGTRRPSNNGLKVAFRIARELAGYGITVVSGMARGIDSEAHRGALEGKGRTIAVLGCGVDICYPPENKKLMAKIIECGAVISEFNIGTPPESYNFPQRNRVIAALSLGIVAVEAGLRSGVLNTVQWAVDYNKEVFVVPGPIFTEKTEGTNKLLKEGAKMVTCVEDILEGLALPLKRELKKIGIEIALTPDEKELVETIAQDPLYVDEICAKLNKPVPEVLERLFALEIKGVIRELPGKRYIKLI